MDQAIQEFSAFVYARGNEPGEEKKGQWNQVFGREAALHVELGTGKGDFISQLALRHPEINFIGIERYSSVLFRALQKLDTLETIPTNLRFICEDASLITDFFAPQEVSRIYLNFSDPWPKERHAKRRLTSSTFLKRYDQILMPDGQIEFKTDNTSLFSFSVEEIQSSAVWEICEKTYDLHHDTTMNADNVLTEYEEKFSSLGNPICKLIARRKER